MGCKNLRQFNDKWIHIDPQEVARARKRRPIELAAFEII
jgi:hypothetical protein